MQMFSRAVCSQPHTFDKYIRCLFCIWKGERYASEMEVWVYDAGYKV